MPFTAKDAQKHTEKATTAKLRRKWYKVANSVLKKCLDDGGSDETCAPAAIIRANGVIAQAVETEVLMPEKQNITEVTKTVDGKSFPASDFLVVEDAESPSTWHLQVKKNGTPDRGLAGAAWAALFSPGGHRGNKYAGPSKEEAGRKLRALYTAEEWDMPTEETESEPANPTTEGDATIAGAAIKPVREIEGDVDDFGRKIRDSFEHAFAPESQWRTGMEQTLYARNILYEDPDLGNTIIVSDTVTAGIYAVDYTYDSDGVKFALRNEWRKVRQKWEIIEPKQDAPPVEAAETFAESDAPILKLVEQETPTDRRAPLEMLVALIGVGAGNKRDNHYYTEALLERDGHVFEGLTMHTVDHREDQRSEGTDVSTVKEVLGVKTVEGKKFLTARVIAYDPGFCEKTRNRATAGQLGKLQCSILAGGEAKPGKIGEEDFNIVQRITEGRFVDWVTRSGAQGHVLQLTESAAEPEEIEPEPEPIPLDEAEAQPVILSEDAPDIQPVITEVVQPLALAEVIAALGKTNLPAASVATIAGASYTDLSEVQVAVAAEVTRLKAAGSGQPLGPTAPPPKPKTKTLSGLQAELQAVNRKWTGGI